MAILDNINEKMRSIFGGNNRAVKPLASDDFFNQVDGMPIQQIAQLVNSLRQDVADKKELYRAYDAMAKDSLIAGALEMWVSDATQIDEETGHVCWAVPAKLKNKNNKSISESANNNNNNNNNLINDINDFLHNKINIDEFLPVIAYRVCVYGEAYIKTYYSEYEEEKLHSKEQRNKALLKAFGETAFDLVQDSLEVAEVIEYNKPCGFLAKDSEGQYSNLYSLMDYVHFCHDRGRNRSKVDIEYQPAGRDTKISRSFVTRFGTSFIESGREAFEVLQLLELILLISRFNRSSYYRIFQIETGGATRLEVTKILQEFKKAINKSETINLSTSKYQSKNQPLPLGGNIYIPVKNGKGQVSIETIQPDQNLREILDLEYYQNKLFAALRTPKAFLGLDESSPQGIGNVSLIVQDVRYARTILDVIDVLRKGVKAWCDWHLIMTGHEDFIDKYEIETAHLLTALENSTLEMNNQRLSYAQSFASLFEQLQETTNPVKMAEYICTNVLHDGELWDKVKSSKTEEEADPANNNGFNDNNGFGDNNNDNNNNNNLKAKFAKQFGINPENINNI